MTGLNIRYIHNLSFIRVFEYLFNNFIPMINFMIANVINNKHLNGASVTAVRVMIHPFASKKLRAEGTPPAFDIARVFVKSPPYQAAAVTQACAATNA